MMLPSLPLAASRQVPGTRREAASARHIGDQLCITYRGRFAVPEGIAMTRSRTILFALLLGPITILPQARTQGKNKGKPRSVDVVVYGATPGGIIAAITV